MFENTVCRRLKLSGLLSFRATKKTFISLKNRNVRFEFANAHRHWTINDWERVLWSDKSKCNLKGSDDNLKVRRRKGKHLDPKYIRGTVKHGGGKDAFVWGCFSGFSEVETIHRINYESIRL